MSNDEKYLSQYLKNVGTFTTDLGRTQINHATRQQRLHNEIKAEAAIAGFSDAETESVFSAYEQANIGLEEVLHLIAMGLTCRNVLKIIRYDNPELTALIIHMATR